MMAARAVLSLCVALAAASGTARAEDAFTTFKSICIDTQANDTDSLAVADKAGWMPIPPGMLDSFPLKSYQGGTQGRMHSTTDQTYILATADSIFPGLPDTHGKMCMMGFYGGVPSFAEQAGAFASVPKREGKDSQYSYLWREENGAHVALTEEDMKSTKLPNALHFLGAGERPKVSFLVFGIASSQN